LMRYEGFFRKLWWLISRYPSIVCHGGSFGRCAEGCLTP
jgi:hypothetical protein